MEEKSSWVWFMYRRVILKAEATVDHIRTADRAKRYARVCLFMISDYLDAMSISSMRVSVIETPSIDISGTPRWISKVQVPG